MKTQVTRRITKDNQLFGKAERSIMRHIRRLQQAEKLLKRRQARALKRLNREAYDWASLGA